MAQRYRCDLHSTRSCSLGCIYYDKEEEKRTQYGLITYKIQKLSQIFAAVFLLRTYQENRLQNITKICIFLRNLFTFKINYAIIRDRYFNLLERNIVMNNDFNPNNSNSFNGNSTTTENPNNNFNANTQQPNFGVTFCNNCGNQIQEGQKFCVKCGTPVNQSENTRCEKCGATVPNGTNFCNACGAPISKTQKMFCQFCGEKYEEGQTFCKKCGNKVVKSNIIENFTNIKSTNAQSASAKSTKPNYNRAKAPGVLLNDLSHPITKFHLIMVGIVVLMFIFSFLPAFSFDVEVFGLSSSKANKAVNDEVTINIMSPFACVEDYKDAGDDFEMVAGLTAVIATIQTAAFVVTFLVLFLPLIKPTTKSGLSKVIPIVFSICAVLYTWALTGMFGPLMGDVSDGSVTASLNFAGWMYIILAIALFVTTILANKKKKELSV